MTVVTTRLPVVARRRLRAHSQGVEPGLVPARLTSTRSRNSPAAKARSRTMVYGNNGWLGLASIGITTGGHIDQGTAKVNDTYASYWQDQAEKNHVLCQEIGHVLGLEHTSENGTSQQTCMDHSSEKVAVCGFTVSRSFGNRPRPRGPGSWVLGPGDALHRAITRTLSQNAACLPYLRIEHYKSHKVPCKCVCSLQCRSLPAPLNRLRSDKRRGKVHG